MPSVLDYSIFRYDDESMIALSDEAYQTLLQTGQVEYAWRDPLHLPRLCLVHSEEHEFIGGSSTFGYEAHNCLSQLLDHGLVARPQAHLPHQLELVESGSLRELLERSIPSAVSHPHRDEIKRSFNTIAPKNLTEMLPEAHKAILRDGHYTGLLSICSCGEAGCGSLGGWIENYAYLLVIEAGGGEWNVKALLPESLL